MDDALVLDGELAQLYAAALHAIGRIDGELGAEEAMRLQELLTRRGAGEIDAEMLFFTRVSPEALSAAARRSGDPQRVGRALTADAVALATVDGDMNGAEAHAVIRYLKALGCSAAEVHAVSPELDEWLNELG